jgi:hypothetical protein
MKLADALSGWLIAELQREGFRFDRDAARYRDNRTGRFVAEQRILDTFVELGEGKNSFAGFAQRNMDNITKRYIDGKIDLQSWQRQMRREIKDSHIVSATAGRGGRDSMTQADWGRTGGRLRQQYGYLDNLAWERFNGTVSDSQMMTRAKMYAGNNRTAYHDGKVAAFRDAGFTEERRVLNPAEHCADCLAYAALGWQPIGSLPEPGQASQCLSNCKCDKEFRSAESEAPEV